MTNQETELCWLAGLLEGEGSFFASERFDRRFDPPSVSVTYTISAVTVDRDVAERAAAALDAKLYGPYPQKNTDHTEFYRVALYKRADVMEALRTLLPLMGKRRQAQIRSVFDVAQRNPVRRTGPRTKEVLNGGV